MDKILYVTTTIAEFKRYFSFVYYPGKEYCELQYKVINILLNHKKNIDIKFYPYNINENPNYEFAKLQRCNVIENKTLSEVLSHNNYSLIITEALATSLLEILCTNSQVVCFFPKDYVKISSENINLLRKRAFVSENIMTYLEDIQMLLTCKYKEKDIDDSFLHKFGLSTDKEGLSNIVKLLN